MKLNPLTAKFWLTMAVTVASLAFASSAAAMNVVDTSSPGLTSTSSVATTSDTSNFNWTYLAIGVAVALAAALIVLAVVSVTRNRSRLAPSH
jgi:hypothetical protein